MGAYRAAHPIVSTLLLVDGSSYLYRAYHALPDLRTRAGEPTGALHGVINMLRRLASEYPSAHRAVVFDAKGKTFRDDLFPEYKAHRPSMPEDLAAQIEPIHAAVRALGWPLLMVEGVEADDVIGTLAVQSSTRRWQTVISTGDKDLTQLVNDHVLWVNTMSGEVLDVPAVVAKFGVGPEQIVDYLALVGDTVDGVPGVEKCGPKTAVKWLQAHGSLDGVIAHAGEIGGVVGENLRRHLDFLPLGRELVTIRCDIELPVSVEALAAQAPHVEDLRGIYSRYEMRSALAGLEGGSKAADSAMLAGEGDGAASLSGRGAVPVRGPSANGSDPGAFAGERAEPASRAPVVAYETVLTPGQLDDWLGRITRDQPVALDTETTSLDPLTARLVGISLCIEPGHACYIPLAHRYPGAPDQLPFDETLARLKAWLESDHPKIGQNLKYDRHVLANHGIALGGVVGDSLLQSYVLESHLRHDLETLARRHLDSESISYESICGKGASQIGFDQVDLDTATKYSAEDADLTLQVHAHLAPQIERDAGLARIYRDIELPLAQVLFEMERVGVRVDPALLLTQSDELGRGMAAIEERAYEAAGQPFNLGSPKQIREILFDRQQLPVLKKTPSGEPSTDEDVLQQLALNYPLPKLILEHRSLSKLKSTYTDKLPRMINPATGRVHTSFGQATAVTGRLSSSEPNLQNIPVRTAEGRRIREAFVAPAGHVLVSADYSQIELRIMAHVSRDPGMVRAFAQNDDIHRATAAEVFGVTPIEVKPDQRRTAKVINFGLIYGMSAFGLAQNLDIERSAAQTYMERYFDRYPGVKAYMDQTRALAREQGYVETVYGRRLWLPDIRGGSGPRRQAAERAAINAPMQGTAADIIKLAMLRVQAWLKSSGLRSRLILQVHDELVIEAPEVEVETVKRELHRIMEGIEGLSVPLLVEVGAGPNWEQAH
jgi:DNA polymerase-1